MLLVGGAGKRTDINIHKGTIKKDYNRFGFEVRSLNYYSADACHDGTQAGCIWEGSSEVKYKERDKEKGVGEPE